MPLDGVGQTGGEQVAVRPCSRAASRPGRGGVSAGAGCRAGTARSAGDRSTNVSASPKSSPALSNQPSSRSTGVQGLLLPVVSTPRVSRGMLAVLVRRGRRAVHLAGPAAGSGRRPSSASPRKYAGRSRAGPQHPQRSESVRTRRWTSKSYGPPALGEHLAGHLVVLAVRGQPAQCAARRRAPCCPGPPGRRRCPG